MIKEEVLLIGEKIGRSTENIFAQAGMSRRKRDKEIYNDIEQPYTLVIESARGLEESSPFRPLLPAFFSFSLSFFHLLPSPTYHCSRNTPVVSDLEATTIPELSAVHQNRAVNFKHPPVSAERSPLRVFAYVSRKPFDTYRSRWLADPSLIKVAASKNGSLGRSCSWLAERHVGARPQVSKTRRNWESDFSI